MTRSALIKSSLIPWTQVDLQLLYDLSITMSVHFRFCTLDGLKRSPEVETVVSCAERFQCFHSVWISWAVCFEFDYIIYRIMPCDPYWDDTLFNWVFTTFPSYLRKHFHEVGECTSCSPGLKSEIRDRTFRLTFFWAALTFIDPDQTFDIYYDKEKEKRSLAEICHWTLDFWGIFILFHLFLLCLCSYTNFQSHFHVINCEWCPKNSS